MDVIVDSIMIKNKKQTLLIYKVDGSDNDYCIGLDGDDEHFDFKKEDAIDIIHSIELVVGNITIGKEVDPIK